MTLKAIDKSFEQFYVDDIVVDSGYGNTYGYKVLSKVYLQEMNRHYFICAEVNVVDNKAETLELYGKPVLKVKDLLDLRSYGHKWTPGETFMAGDVLKDQDNVLYLVASDDRVWNLTKGTFTTQVGWEKPGSSYGDRKFTLVKTAAGDAFSEVVKVEDIKSSI